MAAICSLAFQGENALKEDGIALPEERFDALLAVV